MTAFTFRMPSGIPGALSRPGTSMVMEANVIDSTLPPASYGIPVVVDATSLKIRNVKAADVAASVYGFLVRPFPTQSSTTAYGSAAPVANSIGDVMRMGYLCVKVTNGTPVKNGAVYTRTVLNGAIPAAVLGDVEAVADGTNTFAIPGAYFTGGMDANGNSEIAFAL